MLKKNTIYLLFIIFLTFTSYLFGARPQNELNIYSGRKLSLIEPLIKKFENDTNIKINIITGKSDAFIERLKLEGINSKQNNSIRIFMLLLQLLLYTIYYYY